MRFYRIIVAGVIIEMFILPSFGQDKPEKKENIISVTGRLVLESSKERDRLILYGKDRKVYIIHGNFIGVLESLLSDLGKNNLVSVTGLLREGYDISTKINYGFDKDGTRTLDTRCIRLYHLKVAQINDAKKTKEEIPPPERDYKEELKTKQSVLARIHKKSSAARPIRVIQGKISSLNLRAPIKTVEISSQDRNKILLLSSKTHIVKKSLGTKEPISLGFNSLREDQEVYVEYLEDEYTPEALFITIMQD